MDNFVLNEMLTNYYNVLENVGFISANKTKQLIIIEFLTELVNHPDYYLFATECQQDVVNKLYNCIIENNFLY